MTSVASVRVNWKARDVSGDTTATRTHANTMACVQTAILVQSVLATDMMVRVCDKRCEICRVICCIIFRLEGIFNLFVIGNFRFVL